MEVSAVLGVPEGCTCCEFSTLCDASDLDVPQHPPAIPDEVSPSTVAAPQHPALACGEAKQACRRENIADLRPAITTCEIQILTNVKNRREGVGQLIVNIHIKSIACTKILNR